MKSKIKILGMFLIFSVVYSTSWHMNLKVRIRSLLFVLQGNLSELNIGIMYYVQQIKARTNIKEESVVVLGHLFTNKGWDWKQEKKANGTRGRCSRKRGGQGDGQETSDSCVSQAITHPWEMKAIIIHFTNKGTGNYKAHHYFMNH